MTHKNVKHFTATHVVELLHMDLMRLVHVETLGGKKYVFVFVDDYSRYLIDFIHEKYVTFNVFEGLWHHLRHEKGEKIRKIIRIRSDHDR